MEENIGKINIFDLKFQGILRGIIPGQNATYLHTPWVKPPSLDKLPCLGMISSALEYEGRLSFAQKLLCGAPF